MTIEVIKFGGSSLVNSDAMRRVGQVLVSRRLVPKVVVLSAMGGITNTLLEAGRLAHLGDPSYRERCQTIRDRHHKALLELLSGDHLSEAEAEVKQLLNELEEHCYGLYLLRELSAKSQDKLASFGERLSVAIMSAFLKTTGLQTERWDARALIVTDDAHGAARVDMESTRQRISEQLVASGEVEVCVVEGFIGSGPDGSITTLGRGGSDYTASLIASIAGASHMEKSTDVPGMLTADPRVVPTARIIESLSYEEAMELCHFGAKVIYPPTLIPLRDAGVPLVVRSTFGEDPGTTITQTPQSSKTVRGLSSIDGIALLTLSGGGMVGVPGFSRRLFMALSLHDINVVLITQGSSEHSITVAVEESSLERALDALEEEFGSDRLLGRVEAFRATSGLSILALVGDAMHQQVGVCGRAFAALGQNGVNIHAVAQGSTERNISVVVASADVPKALRALHGAFFEDDIQRVHLVCVGVGQVGAALLDQISASHASLLHSHHLDLRVIALANSKTMCVDAAGVSLTGWRDTLAQGAPASLDELVGQIIELNLENMLFVDNTASAEVAGLYERVLSASVGVVASNKIAASDEIKRYQGLKELARRQRTQYRFEANVGAGLPVIDTLHHLVQSGDQVHRIEAVLSGTLNYIFSALDGQQTLSQSVHGAMEAGFTEPDPRLDLNGVDVQRKILILAREAGYMLNLEDVHKAPFLSDAVMDQASISAFLEALPLDEARMQAQLRESAERGERLRYVATFKTDDAGHPHAEVGLKSLPQAHPFCQLDGSDNAVMIWSDRYRERPLIVQGAGAGADVTAMGVFADIMRFAHHR